MQRMRWVALVLVATVGTGGVPAPALGPEEATEAAVEGHSRTSYVIFDVADCPEEEVALAPIAAILIPQLIDKGLDYLAKWLEKKKEAKNGSTSARGAEEFFCPSGTPKIKGFSFVRESGATVDDMRADFDLVMASDGSAFRAQLRKLDFNKTSAKDKGKGRKDILITGIVESPFTDIRSEEQKGAAAIGVFQVSLEKVKIGKPSTFDPAITGQWISVPSPEADDDQGLPKTMPFSLLVNVQEAEKAGDLLLLAIDAFTETKDDLGTQITKIIKDALGVEDDDDGGDDG